jgi:hypothetical protein
VAPVGRRTRSIAFASLPLLALIVAAAATSAPAAATVPPLLAGIAGEATGNVVDGMECFTSEALLFHIHAHLAVFVGGRRRTIPRGIGIPPPQHITDSDDGPFVAYGKCYYRLHSHTNDGVIHIESPVARVYTLGDYFDIWRQPLGPDQVGPEHGRVIAYVNGQRWTGNPRAIPLTPQALLQLDVGTDVPPKGFTFPPGL